jgi:hypothetical protein
MPLVSSFQRKVCEIVYQAMVDTIYTPLTIIFNSSQNRISLDQTKSRKPYDIQPVKYIT